MSESNDCIQVAIDAARQAGQILLDWQGKISAREKAPRDLVTEADVAAQQAIEDILLSHFPQHAFLGEEARGDGSPGWSEDDKQNWIAEQPYCWIVDPLDGTTNYVHQLPPFAVSLALWQNGEPQLGVVLDPVSNELYSAIAGEGATLNGEPIRVSQTVCLEESLLAASFPANVQRGSVEVARFVEALHHGRAVRRLGSAALNLSYLAAGRLDGYWATSVKPWDVAAGVLFVREAGGLVTDIDGGPFCIDRPLFLAAASPQLHQALLEMFANDR